MRGAPVPGLQSATRISTLFVMDRLTALVGGVLIDGLSGPPVADSVLVVDRDRIVSVGDRSSVTVPPEAELVDMHGRYLLPGLIDVHVHYFEWMGEMFVVHGVTSVKDVGNDVDWIATARDEVGPGRSAGPRIFFTGNGLDVPPPRRDHFIGIENDEMARDVVRALHSRGAIAIKVREMLPVELLRPIVDEAHRLGLKVTGHLRGAMNAREAAEAGIDGLEHASGIVQATLDPWLRMDLDGLEARDVYAKYVAERKAYGLINQHRGLELVRDLAARDVALIPTMSGWWRMPSERRARFAEEDARYADDPNLAYVPDEARAIWSRSELYHIDDPDDLAMLEVGYHKICQLLLEHRANGGSVLAGSDTYLSIPGINLQRELLFLVDVGFTPMEAISMATYENAVFMGQEGDIGSLTVGAFADILVLDADPLASIDNISNLDRVMQGGRWIDRTYHAGYATPTPRPAMERPLWVERQLGR